MSKSNAIVVAFASYLSASHAIHAQQPSATLDEVVVTARKRIETLQDSDASITVLSHEAIDQARLRDVRRLDDLVPNVQFNESGQLSNVFITIRGVESNPFIVNRAAVYTEESNRRTQRFRYSCQPLC